MRLDHFLVEHHLVKSRSQATDYIKRGLVLVNDVKITKAGYEIKDQVIKITEEAPFVSRAGEKLMQAILDFKLDFHDKIVVDIGSSTGGFTDCSLSYGAKLVYAYDVGEDQMDLELRKNPKIQLHEKTNILDVQIPDNDIILIDVSFTSIKPILKHVCNNAHEIVALIKPQFEAGHIKFKSGVLKDQKMHKSILKDVLSYANELRYSVIDIKKTHLLGKSGNQEYLLYLSTNKVSKSIEEMIRSALC
jgi:23S rRNA (cytidine1920-2'-O)/16S rRNA (cytidine1409-2'-O)-methyltransferase